ncbi:MAG: gliding motility-associated C-terminal domain-containing protein, partial [Bacteroidota bacterium]
TVTVTDMDGCTAVASLSVNAPAPMRVDFSLSPITCAGETDAELTATVNGGVPTAGGTAPYNFLWDNQGTTPTIFDLAAGTYTVQVTDANNCTVTASQEIPAVNLLEVSTVIENIKINEPGSAVATAIGGTPPYSYSWNGIVTDSIFTTDKEGNFVVIVEDANGCRASEEVQIIIEVDCFTGRPVITPDGDGLNDEFIINCISQAENNSLQIFNRWGQPVFEQMDYDNTWMGTNSRGVELPEGGYFWLLQYEDLDGTPRQVKGSLTIVKE